MNADWILPPEISYSLLGKCTGLMTISAITAFQSLDPFIPWLYNIGLALSILLAAALVWLISKARRMSKIPMFSPIPAFAQRMQYLLLSLLALWLFQEDLLEKAHLFDLSVIGLCLYFGVLFFGSLLQTKTQTSEV